MLNSYCLKPGEAGTTTRQSRRAWERGSTLNKLHARHVSTRGTCVIAMCRPFSYKCTSNRGQNLSSTSPPRQTLAPPLALDDAGDEALSCRDLTDAVFTPAADIVFSAAAVGVLRRQVRARKIELLGLIFYSV